VTFGQSLLVFSQERIFDLEESPQQGGNVMRIHLSLLTITILLFSAGCSKNKIGNVLTKCKNLKEQNDPDAWRKIAAELEPIYKDKRLKGNENAAAVRNFYVMSLIRTANGEEEKLKAAATIAEDVQNQYPSDFLANFQMGQIRLEQDSPDSAYFFLETAHMAKPEHIPALTLLLNASERSGYPDAGKHFETADRIDTFNQDSKFYNLWGMWLIKQGEGELSSRQHYFNAMNKFKLGYRLDSQNKQLLLNMAVLMDKHLKFPKAAQKYYLCFKNTLGRDERENHVMIQQRLLDLRKQ
jgi:hypothetical protein